MDFILLFALHKHVEGSLGLAVGRVGLLSLLYCTILAAGVDGFTQYDLVRSWESELFMAIDYFVNVD